jgi:hypothetical protein
MKPPQRVYNQDDYYRENRHPNTKQPTPKGEEQSPKAIGVIREKDSLPTKLET